MLGCDAADAPETSSDLTLISVSEDSLYWNEMGWVQLSHPLTPSELNAQGGLELFVHTAQMTIDSVVGSRVHFHGPTNSEGGVVRLYSGGLAVKGEHRIHFLPHDVKFETRFGRLDRSAYPGQTQYFGVQDLPLRRTDWDIYLGGERLEVLHSQEASTLFFTIPLSSNGGVLRARSFNDTVEVGNIEIVRHTGKFLGSKIVKQVTFRVQGLLGKTKGLGIEMSGVSEFVDAHVAFGLPVERGEDSTRVSFPSEVDLVFHEDADGRVSGRVKVRSLNVSNEETIEAQFKNMTWDEGDGYFIAQSYGLIIPQQLLTLKYEQRSDTVIYKEVTGFEGAHGDSYIELIVKY
jgi:hypothetical protein